MADTSRALPFLSALYIPSLEEEDVGLHDITKSLPAQTICDHVIPSASPRENSPSLHGWGEASHASHIHSFAHRPLLSTCCPSGSGLAGAHPSSATLTVVALGLGGLAFPLLPVLLPLFVSDFPFCSLTGKNNTGHVIGA